MALAPKLELRQSQQLVMTPQLQQAIKLLQLSNFELAAFVEEQLEQNPFLERESESDGSGGDAADRPAASEKTADEGLADGGAADALDAGYSDIDPEASRADVANDRAADGPSLGDWSSVGSGKGGGDGDMAFDATLASEVSLRDHLAEQLARCRRLDAMTRMIAAHLIDVVDEAGYLRIELSEVAEQLGAPAADVERALAVLQGFDPAGVGARDLKECMRLQLADRDRLDPQMEAFIENLELLGAHDYDGLKKATGADDEDLRDMIEELRRLTPKPGLAFGGGDAPTVLPDVVVAPAAAGGWKIELNAETLPRVLVNERYFAQISGRGGSDSDKAYVSENMAQANWLVKSLDQRARTILKVSSEIVRQQDAFLVEGVRALRPLNLKTIADAVEMHESTISRVTSNKYMATPRGLFELKYFFTASIASSDGGEAHSAEAVRDRIRELIDREPASAILSDDKIVSLLKDDGVDIARRTVAKYREAMNIPSSVQRRRIKKRAI
ncbi:MAG: RNA polymerase factor sigma-54 [Pseudomonadota bacterium]